MGGKRVGGRCPVSMMSRQFTGGGRAQRGVEGGKGQRHQSWPWRGIVLQSLMRWPVRSRNGPCLSSGEAGGTLCPPVAAAAVPPPSTWRPGDDSRVPFSSACNWGGVLSPSGIMEPLMKMAWGQQVHIPRTWHTFSSKVRMLFF